METYGAQTDARSKAASVDVLKLVDDVTVDQTPEALDIVRERASGSLTSLVPGRLS